MSTDPLRTAKSRLRSLVVDRILAMSEVNRLHEEQTLQDCFQTLPGFDQAKIVLLFIAHLPEEVATRSMIEDAIGRGKTVVCPRVDRKERRLRLFRLDSFEDDLVPGPFGIPEPKPGSFEFLPKEIDWALIPGIAFDVRGYRLGRGAGFYDRLIPLLNPKAPRLALILDPQWVDEVPTEPHDQPVHGVIGTQRSWLSPEFPAS
ncbi:5-formyltetrahydrofolate cyclo-ligase [Tautonia rosea]|uniref:5-formyltetrahydrofolate cyclo-ligase n=1 Tax=Tautonia rosea TaxID=2728037 RepID=UPI0014739328|nr:5-formyltetrahydrofolate cyclo-ligase [Tautonia rosea]